VNQINNGGNTPVSNQLKSDFMDSAHWDTLAERLMPYRMPDWDVPATVQDMGVWLDRLEINEKVYREAMNTSLHEWVDLNPTWPLRAFVGLLLEYKASP